MIRAPYVYKPVTINQTHPIYPCVRRAYSKPIKIIYIDMNDTRDQLVETLILSQQDKKERNPSFTYCYYNLGYSQ